MSTPTPVTELKAMETVITTTDQEILAALDKELARLRPIFQRDGGDVRVLTVAEGVAQVSLGNECAGCGSGVMSMAPGLRLMLLEKVPGLKDVVFG